MKFKVKCFGICLLGFWGVVIAVVWPLQAAAFSVGGKVQVCAFPLNCIERVVPGDERTYLYDTEVLLGPGNNWAIAEYYGDIAKGYVGAWVKATRGWDGVWWRPASAATGVWWDDILIFSVPAGSYSEGLYVEATGSVSGRIGKSGAGTQAKVSYHAQLGSAPSGYYDGHIALESSDPDQEIVVDEEFTLRATLVNPGTELTNPITVEIPISAGLGRSSILVASTWAGGIYDAWVLTDFAHSMSFHAITAPPGVAWNSESGVFLSEPVDTCDGDFDNDGDVDGSDLAVFAADFGRTDCDTGTECEGDFDDDDDVDGSDLAVFAADFGRTDCRFPGAQ